MITNKIKQPNHARHHCLWETKSGRFERGSEKTGDVLAKRELMAGLNGGPLVVSAEAGAAAAAVEEEHL